jgi:YD repeat-containing protein
MWSSSEVIGFVGINAFYTSPEEAMVNYASAYYGSFNGLCLYLGSTTGYQGIYVSSNNALMANGSYYASYGGNCGATPYGNPDRRGSSYPGFFCPLGYQKTYIFGFGYTCQSSKFYSPKTPPTCHSGCCANNPILIGNPIEASLGTKSQNEIDYVSNGLTLDRTYISSGVFSPTNIVGKNWRFGFDRRLTLNYPSEIMASRPNGTYLAFQLINNVWVSDADITDKLKAVIGGGWSYFDAGTNSTENYDTNGFLTTIVKPSGRTTTFSNNGDGTIQTITDNFGRQITFIYAAGNVSQVKLPDGNLIDYSYDAAGNLKTVTYPDDTPAIATDNPKKTYLYGGEDSEAGNICSLSNTPACTPDLGVSYTHALTGITDENGVRYATYKYDGTGRAVSTEHATGGIEKYSLAYAPDGTSTAVTDPLGSVRTTHFTTVLGVVKPTGTDQPLGSGCAAASSHTEYDANGNVASRTDFNGHKTCYAYDMARNLETARVEGIGLPSVTDCTTVLGAGETLPANTRKISTAWHPSYRLPVTVAEPNRLTTTSYDANGNVLTRSEQATTDANGAAELSPVVYGPVRKWTYTYNSLGQMLTADGPRPVADAADKTTYTYYPSNDPVLGNRGNLKDRTNALGHKTTFNTYNANGQSTRITAANGTVTDLEYFARGWLKTLTVTAGGNSPPPPEVTRYTYDGTGLLKTVTLPDTSTLTYTYDAAHRLTDIEDSFTLSTAPTGSHNKVHYDLDNSGNRYKETYTDPNGALKSSITRSYDALGRLQTLTTGGGQ